MLLQEIKLQTNSVAALFEFYKDVIELPVTRNNNFISIKTGKSQLIFEENSRAERPFYHFAFNIPSNKLDEAFKWLQNKMEILWLDDYNGYIADFKSWNAKSFYFLDPAGNIGELIARFDMNDIEQENFSSKQIRNVSEIGLVFPDATFDRQTNEILSEYQLDYFSKQPPLEHFRAIGDDEGLFIVVPQKRNWFSTKLPSGIFPLSIKFKHHEREFFLEM
jgi:catechol-2,3-dioxygenase